MKKNIFSKIKVSSSATTSKRAFVLIETIVAVSIILLVVPAVLGMTTRGISVSSYSKSQMTANYLAEEGVEVIRNKRDHNFLQQQNGVTVSWDDGFGSGSAVCTVNPCIINPLLGVNGIQACNGGSMSTNPPSDCYRLYADSNGFYTNVATGNTVTPFWRGVKVTQVSAKEYVVASTVTWNTTFLQKSITVTGYMTNWPQ